MKRTLSALVILLLPCISIPPADAAAPRAVAAALPDSAAGIAFEEAGLRLGGGILREPTGVAVDLHGYVYVADAMAGKVFRFAPDSTYLEFEQPPDRAGFYPIDLAVQESFILVLDYSANQLLRYDYRGSYLDVFLSFDQFGDIRPVSVSVASGGSIAASDIRTHTVSVWSPLLDLELAIGGFGRGEGRFDEPRKAAFLPGLRLAVVESANRRLQLFSPSGRYERAAAPPAATPFVAPRSVSADPSGTVFVSDPEAGRVFAFSVGGSFLGSVAAYGGRAIAPAAAAPGWDGSLYVADLKSRSIILYRILSPRVK